MNYLFEGQVAGTRYSETSLEHIIKAARTCSGINRNLLEEIEVLQGL